MAALWIVPVVSRAQNSDYPIVIVKSIEFGGISTGEEFDLRSRLAIHVGDALSAAQLIRAAQTAREFDSRLSAACVSGASAECKLYIGADFHPIVHLSENLGHGMGKPKTKVDPEYPAAAKAAGIQGTVHLIANIAIDGAIRDVQVASGDPLLTAAAVECVKKWVFNSSRLNDFPVESAYSVSVNFTLP
jgi:TonB family protein